MADTFRYRYGEPNLREVPADGTSAIEIGDLVAIVSGLAVPVSALADFASEVLSAEAVHDAFAGVAMSSYSGDDSAAIIVVATQGVFEYPCASDTFVIGEIMTAASTGTTEYIPIDQQVKTTPTGDDMAEAIGRCAQTTLAAQTTVLIEIQSTVLSGVGGMQTPIT